MKRFRFRLEQVLRVRRLQEDADRTNVQLEPGGGAYTFRLFRLGGSATTVLRVDGGMTASDFTMQFLADIYVQCDECEGRRYQHQGRPLVRGKGGQGCLHLERDRPTRIVDDVSLTYPDPPPSSTSTVKNALFEMEAALNTKGWLTRAEVSPYPVLTDEELADIEADNLQLRKAQVLVVQLPISRI